MRRPPLPIRLSPSAAAVACLVAVALVLATAFDSAPMQPQKTLPILLAAEPSTESGRSAYYERFHSQLIADAERFESNKVIAWSFSRGVPEGWAVTRLTDVQTRGRSGTTVRTTPKNFERQLRSPTLSLDRGYYDIVVEGSVVRGGLVVGAERGSVCLGNSFFSADQLRERRGTTLMVRRVNLRGREPIRLVLSNWAYPDQSSLWNISRVFVRRLSFFERPPVRAAFARPSAQLVSRGAATASSVVRDWDFRKGLGSGWTAELTTTVARAAGKTTIRTSARNYSYALSSEPITLDKGSHSLVVDGAVVRGGLGIGILTLEKSRKPFLAYEVFWFGQDFSKGSAIVKFSVEVPSAIRIVLSNWSPPDRQSEWHVRSVRLLVNLTN